MSSQQYSRWGSSVATNAAETGDAAAMLRAGRRRPRPGGPSRSLARRAHRHRTNFATPGGCASLVGKLNKLILEHIPLIFIWKKITS